MALFETLSPITTPVWVLPEFQDDQDVELNSLQGHVIYLFFQIVNSVSEVNSHFSASCNTFFAVLPQQNVLLTVSDGLRNIPKTVDWSPRRREERKYNSSEIKTSTKLKDLRNTPNKRIRNYLYPRVDIMIIMNNEEGLKRASYSTWKSQCFLQSLYIKTLIKKP